MIVNLAVDPKVLRVQNPVISKIYAGRAGAGSKRRRRETSKTHRWQFAARLKASVERYVLRATLDVELVAVQHARVETEAYEGK